LHFGLGTTRPCGRLGCGFGHRDYQLSARGGPPARDDLRRRVSG
jgi:hypothetical protein